MRIVFAPVELTPRYLAAPREMPTFLAAQVERVVVHNIDTGRYDEALAAAERMLSIAQITRDAQAQGLILLYKAEALRRLQRWAEALGSTQQASTRLRAEVTQTAAYNRAVTLYFEGLLHFILHADEHVLRAFITAQETLVESERFWGFEDNRARVGDCQNLRRWMSWLLELLFKTPSGDGVMIVPVYEWVHQALTLVGAVPVTPFPAQFPNEVLGAYLPSNYVPLNIETVSFLNLNPDTHYLALKIARAGDLLSQSRAGDLLLIEAASPGPPRDLVFTNEAPFVRRVDGQISFGPYDQHAEPFTGIARLLIRKEDTP